MKALACAFSYNEAACRRESCRRHLAGTVNLMMQSISINKNTELKVIQARNILSESMRRRYDASWAGRYCTAIMLYRWSRAMKSHLWFGHKRPTYNKSGILKSYFGGGKKLRHFNDIISLMWNFWPLLKYISANQICYRGNLRGEITPNDYRHVFQSAFI